MGYGRFAVNEQIRAVFGQLTSDPPVPLYLTRKLKLFKNFKKIGKKEVYC